MRDQLTAEQIAFLHGLPERVELEVEGVGTVLFCHATPRNDTEVFIEGRPTSASRRCSTGVSADVVVCGHTHMQFQREVSGITVVNAGSVGMPYEEEPGAYWALLGPGIEHRRTEYDAAPLAASAFPGPKAPDLPTTAEGTAFMETIAVGA